MDVFQLDTFMLIRPVNVLAYKDEARSAEKEIATTDDGFRRGKSISASAAYFMRKANR